MKFNFSVKAKTAQVNHAGAKAYSLTPEMELYAAVATTLLSDKSYESADGRLDRLRLLISQVRPEFVAKLAVYARKEMNLRTVPVVLATELAKLHKGDSLVSKTVRKVVQRPDEIMELLAYYQLANERISVKKLNKLSKQVQKGLADSFNEFDEYQFAKYNRDNVVKLRDALFLVHPKAKDESQQLLFNKIVAGELETPYTWETELSACGKMNYDSPEEKQSAMTLKWEELIDSGKLGYMALLRNLRNILEANVSVGHIQKVGDFLEDERMVMRSKQLPFRFLAAYREIKAIASGYTSYLMNALERAISISIANMGGFDLATRVVIACDVSGSMQKAISAKSKILLYDIGLLLGMLLQSRCKNVLTGMFGDTWKRVALPSRGILSNVDAFYKREGEVGYSTNGFLVLKDLINNRYVADKVILFTDVQMWDSQTGNVSAENTVNYQWSIYKAMVPGAKLYLFDLAGYGNIPVRMMSNDVYLIAGWSDKVFTVLDAIDNGEDVMDVIERIEI